MKKILSLLIFLLLLFISCIDEPPVLPGLTKSRIVFITDPDSISVMLNNDNLDKVTPFTIDDLDPGFFKIDLNRITYLDTSIYFVLKRNVSDTISIEMREDPPFWWEIYNTSNSEIPTNQVAEIEVDAANNKWITTRGSGLLKFDGTEFTVYNTANSGIPDDNLNDIFIEENGILWVTTDNGFAKFDGTAWIVFNQQNLNLPDNIITCITKDKEGIYWLGTTNGGLLKFDGADVTIYNYFNSGLPTNHVNTITIDENNIKWIGTWGEGIATLNGDKWEVYDKFDGLFSSFISKIIQDQEGNKLIAAASSVINSVLQPGALYKFDGISFSNLHSVYNELPGSTVMDIAFDENQRLWLATDEGLARFDGNKVKIYNSANSGLPTNFVLSVAIDLNQDKWVSTFGLGKYTGGKK
ncbi:MAG: hypothetical protein EHM47_10330 [Ignavibacteriales bacterium]|nr:MAG: hypothetical protein EHM47_10330 [Ignavibacteriales bacterium]